MTEYPSCDNDYMRKIMSINAAGTLFNYENQLYVSGAYAFKAARQNGHRVYICTGRSKAKVYPFIWDIGLDGIIGGFDSYAKDCNQVVMPQLITTEQGTHVVDWLTKRQLEFLLEATGAFLLPRTL